MDYPPPTPGRCGWPTGTAGGGPARCGKPAKATVNVTVGDIEVPEVCGIHARKSAVIWRDTPEEG